jgi:hypothetical protein
MDSIGALYGVGLLITNQHAEKNKISDGFGDRLER